MHASIFKKLGCADPLNRSKINSPNMQNPSVWNSALQSDVGGHHHHLSNGASSLKKSFVHHYKDLEWFL